MVSQAILIGIIAGVFIAGLGIGYVIYQSSTTIPMMITPQQMTQMMNDPKQMT